MCTLNPLKYDASIYRTAYCGPSGVLIIEVLLYRTVYCGPDVLSIEVLLNGIAYYSSNGVLIIEVSQYGSVYCGSSGVLTTEVPVLSVHNILHGNHMYCRNSRRSRNLNKDIGIMADCHAFHYCHEINRLFACE